MKSKTCLSLLLLIAFGFNNVDAKPIDRYNVVLIVCDDLNDYITGIQGERGHPQARTPHVQKLADSGVAFRRAYSNNPICAPSRSSFLTGVYPHTSGNLFFDKWWENEILNNSRTLMDYFRENGYYTAGSGKLMHHNRKEEWCEFMHKADYGPFVFDGKNRTAHPSVPKPYYNIGPVDGSFASLDDVPYSDDDNPKSGWIYGTWGKGVQVLKYNSPEDRDPTPDERNARWAADRIRKFASDKSGKPFFLGVGFIRPHTPLHVPRKYFDMFPLDKLQAPLIKSGDADDTHYANLLDSESKGLKYFREINESFPGKDEGIKRFTQAYLASVAAVDECIGQVVAAVDSTSLKENTIIVLTSDHGWIMGQKDYLFKNAPWEESTRVPFILRAPGIAEPGGVAEHPISLIDLYPTLADLCGLKGDTRKNKKGAKLDGHSVRPFLENPGSMKWDGPDGALTMIYTGRPSNNDPHKQHWTLRTRRWRYIRYNDGSEELYDHDKDPHEWKNLAGSPEFAPVKKVMNQKIEAMQGEMKTIKPPKSEWDWFRAVDTDRDNKITLDEWLKWSKGSDRRNKRKYDKEQRKRVFKKRDTDGDGFMSRKELEAMK